MAIGERIRLVRKEKGMTQKQLADEIGVAEITIRQYEAGKRNPKSETIKRIAAALGCTADYLEGKVALPTQRLTFVSEAEHGKFISLGNAGKRLAAYEDTGFTPDEIAALKRENEQLKAKLQRTESERDAAISDLHGQVRAREQCEFCAGNKINLKCEDCAGGSNWQWRGLENRHGQD